MMVSANRFRSIGWIALLLVCFALVMVLAFRVNALRSQVHRTEPYWLLDAMARYQFNDQLSATLNVNNLLDKHYYTIFSWYSTYTWGEPRNVRLTLNYKF